MSKKKITSEFNIITELVQRGNLLKGSFLIDYDKNIDLRNYLGYKTSPEYIFCDSVVVQFKLRMLIDKMIDDFLYFQDEIHIRFKKLHQDDDLIYTGEFTSNLLGVQDKVLRADDGTWQMMYEGSCELTQAIDVQVVVKASPGEAGSFSRLHEDSDLIDFELRGSGGSVQVHRAVLAASSPALGRLVSGPWKEATERYADISGVTQLTLQHFKDYLYLGTLPAEGLEHLLVLASCYLMPGLEDMVVFRLQDDLTAERALELLEFAASHKFPKLTLMILKCIKYKTVDINDMISQLVDTVKKMSL